MATVLSDANAICSARQLGEVLGLSMRQIHHLEGEGVLKRTRSKVSERRYKLADSVQSYLRYRDDYVKRKFSINGDQAYADARSRRMAALAIVEETRARQLSLEFVRRDRVVQVMTQLIGQAKNHLLALPTRLARQLIMQRDPRKIREMLDTAVRNCLIECSKFGEHFFDESGKKAVRKNDHESDDERDLA